MPRRARTALPLRALPRKRLLAMRAAGDEVLECYGALSRGNTNLILDFLRGSGTFEANTPYPKGAVLDQTSMASFYYHSHRLEEHGHFHTFAMDADAQTREQPPDLGSPASPRPYSHLVGIKVDDHGIATGLFTTNRWVTGETFRPASEVIAKLDGFVVDHASPSWLVNRWITALLRLFRPQIEKLLHDRDAAISRHGKTHGVEGREARELEIPSEMTISIDRQVGAVERALKA